MDTADEAPEFRHDPLDDSRACIRLLRILSVDLARDVPVRCELSTWPAIDEAPKYIAISYTWGDVAVNSNILINGKRMNVRSNCEYVLRQTRPYIKDGYLWIDAVCINQNDNDEKSDQVAKMGEVFKKATQVFACVGEHKDDSDLLYSIVKKDERYLRSWHSILPKDRKVWIKPVYYYPKVLLWKLKLHLRSISTSRLRKALKAFLSRPYFHRVWIYQELFLAQIVGVICGHETVPVSWIWTAYLVLHVEIASRRRKGRLIIRCEPRHSFWDMAAQVGLLQAGSTSQESMPLVRAMAGVLLLHCQDPRDRFYGTLSIIDWEGQEPIQPDYSKDKFDLAVEVLKRLDYMSDLGILLIYAGQIRKLLELTSEPGRNLLGSVNHHISANLEAADTESPMDFNKISDTTDINTCLLTGLRLSCHKGQWRFQKNSKAQFHPTIAQRRHESTTRTQQLSSDILLPPEARDGDWLLLPKFDLFYDLYFLLARETDHDLGRSELVGKALSAESPAEPSKWKKLVDHSDPMFKVYLDAEDLFCLLSSLRGSVFRHPRKVWNESTVNEYFKTRLCRKRYSSFAVRQSINSPGTGPEEENFK